MSCLRGQGHLNVAWDGDTRSRGAGLHHAWWRANLVGDSAPSDSVEDSPAADGGELRSGEHSRVEWPPVEATPLEAAGAWHCADESPAQPDGGSDSHGE